MYILKEGKSLEGSKVIWSDANKFKLFLILLLTPFCDPLVQITLSESEREDQQIVLQRTYLI